MKVSVRMRSWIRPSFFSTTARMSPAGALTLFLPSGLPEDRLKSQRFGIRQKPRFLAKTFGEFPAVLPFGSSFLPGSGPRYRRRAVRLFGHMSQGPAMILPAPLLSPVRKPRLHGLQSFVLDLLRGQEEAWEVISHFCGFTLSTTRKTIVSCSILQEWA